MNLSNIPSDTVSKSSILGMRALVAALVFNTLSCVSPQNAQPMNESVQKNEMSEGNIEKREYCVLIGTTAYIQAGIEFQPEMRSLGKIKDFVEMDMKNEHIKGKVTVKMCGPIENEEGVYTYITIHVEKVGTTEIYSRDPAIAREISYQIKINDELYYPGMKF